MSRVSRIHCGVSQVFVQHDANVYCGDQLPTGRLIRAPDLKKVCMRHSKCQEVCSLLLCDFKTPCCNFTRSCVTMRCRDLTSSRRCLVLHSKPFLKLRTIVLSRMIGDSSSKTFRARRTEDRHRDSPNRPMQCHLAASQLDELVD